VANERTYLAWVRTSLSNMTVGIGNTKQCFIFHEDDTNSFIGKCIGTVFISMGMVYLVFACMRYFHSQESMTKGKFPSSRSIILFSSIMTLCALIAIFVIIAKKYYT
ncbi:hypothetical protein BDF20DRAFT_812829, partial [Mycotypha africana]|uniref:uncharacterized protein n=1 Tax=Mycotypha africana TaxID=64632 RepID=UPI002300955C